MLNWWDNITVLLEQREQTERRLIAQAEKAVRDWNQRYIRA
jgi:hypothetical protein